MAAISSSSKVATLAFHVDRERLQYTLSRADVDALALKFQFVQPCGHGSGFEGVKVCLTLATALFLLLLYFHHEENSAMIRTVPMTAQNVKDAAPCIFRLVFYTLDKAKTLFARWKRSSDDDMRPTELQ